MKKFVSLCLLIALVCSLCASGVSAAALSPEELYEKYATIIDALEAGVAGLCQALSLGGVHPVLEQQEPVILVIRLVSALIHEFQAVVSGCELGQEQNDLLPFAECG